MLRIIKQHTLNQKYAHLWFLFCPFHFHLFHQNHSFIFQEMICWRQKSLWVVEIANFIMTYLKLQSQLKSILNLFFSLCYLYIIRWVYLCNFHSYRPHRCRPILNFLTFKEEEEEEKIRQIKCACDKHLFLFEWNMESMKNEYFYT